AALETVTYVLAPRCHPCPGTAPCNTAGDAFTALNGCALLSRLLPMLRRQNLWRVGSSENLEAQRAIKTFFRQLLDGPSAAELRVRRGHVVEWSVHLLNLANNVVQFPIELVDLALRTLYLPTQHVVVNPN